MELHERLATSGSAAEPRQRRRPFAELKNRVHMAVIAELGPQLFNVDDEPSALRERVIAEIRRSSTQEAASSRDDRERLVGEIADDILGHGPLERLLADDSITEIMVNGPHEIWIERQGQLYRDDASASPTSRTCAGSSTRWSPRSAAASTSRRRWSTPACPTAAASTRSSRRSRSRARCSRSASSRKDRLDLDGPRPARDAHRAEPSTSSSAASQAELNILISGGTGTGKTTLLNALSAAIPDDERIVTIEDAAELQLNQRHVLRLESRPQNIEGEGEITIRELVRNSLRMRPDRIIVGEVRGAEALDMLQAMNTGHDGSLSTVHANSPRDALARVETMVLMAGYDLPMRAIRQQVASALDLIVHLERLDDGSRRVTAITEVQRMEGDVITLQDLFEFKVDRIDAGRQVVGELAADRPAPGVPREVRAPRHRAPARPLRRPPARRARRRVAVVMRRRLAALGALLLVAAAAVPTLAAAAALEIAPVTRLPFPERGYVVSSSDGAALDASSLQVRENGGLVRDVRVTPVAASGLRFGAILAVDASKSMAGDALRPLAMNADSHPSLNERQEGRRASVSSPSTATSPS